MNRHQRRAAAKQPQTFGPARPQFADEGFRHHQAGRLDRARALYLKALAVQPNDARALHLLGALSHQQGNSLEAVELVTRALRLRPEYPEAHSDLGNALRDLGRLAEAESSYRQALCLRPDYPEAHNNLGIALYALDRLAEAEASYREALRVRPEYPDAHNNLGGALYALGRLPEAEASYREALHLRPEYPEAHNNLGGTLYSLGRLEEAEASYREALRLRPDYAEAHSNLGNTLCALGRFDDARSCFQRALEYNPELPGAHGGLAVIGTRAGGESQLQHLRALLARADCPETDRIVAGFALGRLLDNADRYDEAFPCFAEANALYRRQLAARGEVYDHAALQQRVNGLIQTCTPALYSMVEDEGDPSEVPVFIVGMPRSGTTLIEQIAASHSRVFGAGELKDIPNIAATLQAHGKGRSAEEMDPDLAHRLAHGYVARLQDLGSGSERVIDKMPDNIFYCGLIGVVFPKARVIFCRRDPRDTCLSCYFQRFTDPLAFAQNLADCGLRALELERLATHWRSVLPLRMLTIDYESLVADLEGESRRMIEFLGMNWEPACIDFHKTKRPVLTASGWQVRQPIYNRSVGRWRHYERHLDSLLEVLGHNLS